MVTHIVFFDNLIDVIKFVRSFSEMGLVDSKCISEIWLQANGHATRSFEVCEFSEVKNLCALVGKVLRGEWTLDTTRVTLKVEKEVTNSDIMNL